MKTRLRELAKPGIYGTVDNPIVVSERELREIAETFVDVKKAPVSLNGHWLDPSKPRLGNVVSVTFDEATKTLTGTVEEHDVLASVVDDGFFPDVSIGGKRRASDGKMYLHHLAYLGEEPPAVKNLVSDISRALEGAEPQDDDPAALAASDSSPIISIPSSRAPRLILSDPAATNPPKEAPAMDELTQAKADLDAEKKKSADQAAEIERYKAQLSKLATKYPDEGIELSDAADPRVAVLTASLRAEKKAGLLRSAAGKVPKGQTHLVEALADNLAIGTSIELSDSSGKKASLSQIDLVQSLLDAIPAPVESGRLDLSDGGDQKPLDMSKIMSRV